ncbi:hypothetical protein BDN72DRAFT_855761 [Pluteus cervinus]|uniref:Uncharacterized protein n=1 Tax=Pluteus cervinus TaxID=181527 RepID=A0ACD3B279_9AGAR|nr:hypothetical protein BDN72DRAFT_855761 [Pluteus cervinus]
MAARHETGLLGLFSVIVIVGLTSYCIIAVVARSGIWIFPLLSGDVEFTPLGECYVPQKITKERKSEKEATSGLRSYLHHYHLAIHLLSHYMVVRFLLYGSNSLEVQLQFTGGGDATNSRLSTVIMEMLQKMVEQLQSDVVSGGFEWCWLITGPREVLNKIINGDGQLTKP